MNIYETKVQNLLSDQVIVPTVLVSAVFLASTPQPPATAHTICASIIQLHHAPRHLTCSTYPHSLTASIPVIGTTR